MRRADLRDAARLDRVQPLERRAGARLGPRRDGASRSSRRTRCTRGRSSSAATDSRSSTARPTSRGRARRRHQVGSRAASRRCARTAAPARDAARADVLPPLRATSSASPEAARDASARRRDRCWSRRSSSDALRRERLRADGGGTGPTQGGGYAGQAGSTVPSGPPGRRADRTAGAVVRSACSAGIENLVLIREAELELDAGLNAITGETGAGKTILSNAIGLLLGVARRCGGDRRRRRRGVRRGGVRPARRRRARRARRAAARGRGGARRSRGGSSPTGAPAPTRGAAAPRARTSPPRSRRCSR